MSEFDRSLFLLINGYPGSAALLVGLAVVLAKYVVVLVPLHLALVWTGGGRAMRFVALSGLLALVIALAFNQAVGFATYRPRPFVIGLGNALIDHRASSSMPSNHATVFFAYAATLALFARRGLAATFAILGVLVAWSRVFLGIHYPLDMAAAAVVSAAAAVAATWIMARRGAAGLAWAERAYDRVLALVPRRRSQVCTDG